MVSLLFAWFVNMDKSNALWTLIILIELRLVVLDFVALVFGFVVFEQVCEVFVWMLVRDFASWGDFIKIYGFVTFNGCANYKIR